MPTYVKVGGAWKLATAYVKVGGIWKAANPNIKVGGAWKSLSTSSITVDANWGSVSGTGSFQTSPTRTLTVPGGSPGNITMSPSVTGSGTLQYNAGGGYTNLTSATGITVSNGQTLAFRFAGADGEFGVVNVTDATTGASIGSFSGFKLS